MLQVVDLIAIIRLKVSAGVLPKDAPVKMFAGYGTGKVCAACDGSTTKKDVEYEVDMADGRTLSFHQPCITLWHQERGTYLKAVNKSPMIRRDGGPAKTDTDTEGEYRVLLTNKPDATYTRRFLAKADENAEPLRIGLDGQSLTFVSSGDLLADTRLIDKILKSMDLPGSRA
jgi:hypothetical protein